MATVDLLGSTWINKFQVAKYKEQRRQRRENAWAIKNGRTPIWSKPWTPPNVVQTPTRKPRRSSDGDRLNQNYQVRAIQTANLRGIDYGTVLGRSAWSRIKSSVTRLPKTVVRQTGNVIKDTGKGIQRTASIVKNVATGDFSKASRQTGRLAKSVTVNLATNVVKSGAHLAMQAGRAAGEGVIGVAQAAGNGLNIAKRILRRGFRIIIRKAIGKQSSSLNGDFLLGANETTPAAEQSILQTADQAYRAAATASPGNKRGIIKAICMGAATAILALVGQPYLVPLAPIIAGAAFDLAWKDENADSATYSEMAQNPGIQPNSDGATTVPSYEAPQSNVSMPAGSLPGLYPEQQYQQPQENSSNNGTILAVGGAALAAMLLI